MKHYIRIVILLFALLWTLAWTMTGEKPPEIASGKPPEKQPEQVAAPYDGTKMLRVLHGGAVEEMTMEQYLLGVLRAEMPASFELEALKAQAIAARTYTLYKMRSGEIANHPNADACDNINCCKAYMTAEDAAAQWGSMAVYYEEKLLRAVRETDGQVVLYEGEPILAVFCSSVGGSTQNAGAVWQRDLPYLQSVSSPETEALVPNYYSAVRFSAEEFCSLVHAACPDADLSGSPANWIRDIRRSDAGFVTQLTVGGAKMRGNELRAALSLRSPSFTVEVDGDTLTFHVTGYGHGVGMSQYGANAMAQEGKTCADILTHYFAGTVIGAA